MTTKARIEHTFNCSAETYWSKIFFDEEYNRRMFLDAMNFQSWTLVSQDDKGDRIERVVDAVPDMPDLPGPLKKLAESGVGYREKSTFDKEKKRLKVDVEPASLKGKLFISGEIYCEPAGDNQCRRVYDAVIECKVFGVGGVVEKRLLGDIQDSYNKAAEFTNRFIAEKGY